MSRTKFAGLAGAAIVLAVTGGCSFKSAHDGNTASPPVNTTVVAAKTTPSSTASAAPTTAGFSPDSTPLANPTLGAWPYFGMMEGYERFDEKNIASSEAKKYLEDVPYDHWQFFDGTKLITVEGRTMTTGGKGTTASFFQIQKTYEKLVHDLGGVTVYEGTGKPMKDDKIMFSDRRYRANYVYEEDQMGVYMVRTPTRQIWVEVYHPWEDNSKNYWLTIVEKKALEVKVKMIPAEVMKSALDSVGHVALYLSFDTDKTDMKPESAPVLSEIVKLMKANPALKLTVEGHTDNAGTPAHNQALSEGRAFAVATALKAQGIATDRLQSMGFGQSKPIADNLSEDGRAKNRRVELVKR
ncbi:OmpA family protein [Sphingomonas immobilis]|uniref:OmpA family protein n=1 Tax=Sphingomonas immobilis TaxID=3063997 RepID=A0ABT8ZXW0_9SPHN|nr:OmpA family protein [Sphingomonas sp. CA1-15]MDO7841850.1 OmpA family protein [Sphingomonas sp. CA1-15]